MTAAALSARLFCVFTKWTMGRQAVRIDIPGFCFGGNLKNFFFQNIDLSSVSGCTGSNRNAQLPFQQREINDNPLFFRFIAEVDAEEEGGAGRQGKFRKLL